jgi:hypothetical protein
VFEKDIPGGLEKGLAARDAAIRRRHVALGPSLRRHR